MIPHQEALGEAEVTEVDSPSGYIDQAKKTLKFHKKVKNQKKKKKKTAATDLMTI